MGGWVDTTGLCGMAFGAGLGVGVGCCGTTPCGDNDAMSGRCMSSVVAAGGGVVVIAWPTAGACTVWGSANVVGVGTGAGVDVGVGLATGGIIGV